MIYKEILRSFLLFVISFFTLFVLIDYCTHFQAFSKISHVSYTSLLTYYQCIFIKHAVIFISLSFLLASLKTLLSLNKSLELFALLTSGISIRKILIPFFAVCFLLTGFLILNFEILSPKAETFITHFESTSKKKNKKKIASNSQIFSLESEDGKKLIFQKKKEFPESLYDVFYILSSDELYHFSHVENIESNPIGYFGDHLKRNELGTFEKIASIKEKAISFPIKQEIENTSLEMQSVSSLYKKLHIIAPSSKDNPVHIQTTIYAKVACLLIPLLSLFSIIPFCVRFSRNLAPFFYFALAIGGFIVSLTLIDALSILASHGICNPSFVLILPIALVALVFGNRFRKVIL